MPHSGLMHHGKIKVWDLFVRVFHWSVVLGFLANMYGTEPGEWLHRWIGYVMVSLIAGRILWGFWGTPHARFRSFFPTPPRIMTYFKLLIRGKEPRYISHNPAGALMMIALIFALLGCILTGWMQGLDRFWGVLWVQEVHEIAADSILVLAALHVAGAVFASCKHRENLIWSMITGYKRAWNSQTDVAHHEGSTDRR